MRENISVKHYREVVNEVEMMKKIKHPHIIQLYDSFIDRQFDTVALKKSLHKKQQYNNNQDCLSVREEDDPSIEQVEQTTDYS